MVCRGRAPKAELLRFAAGAGGMVWDRAQRLPGRGAYLHPRLECWRRMVKPSAWERALRAEPGAVSAEALEEARRTAGGVIEGAEAFRPSAAAAVKRIRL